MQTSTALANILKAETNKIKMDHFSTVADNDMAGDADRVDGNDIWWVSVDGSDTVTQWMGSIVDDSDMLNDEG